MNTELPFPVVDDNDDPAPRTAAELPTKDIERVRALAGSLGCVLTDDLCALAGVKPSTAEAWAKRHQGPDFVMLGNRRLYPREALQQFIMDRVRVRRVDPRSQL